MSGISSLKLGRMGEKKFSDLCSQQNATCNKSDEDDHGWDYIVEAELDHQSKLPADLRDGVIRSLIQVKTTRGHKRVAKVKLSNALKAIQTDLPCFLTLVVFDGNEVEGFYVRHFWKDEIERTLKRAREAHRDNQDDLHKIYLQFSLEGLENVQSNLIEALCEQVSKRGKNYAQEKKKLRESVGYSEARAIGKFTFDNGVTAKDIVDWQLTDDAQLPLSNFDMKDMRFGIPASAIEQPTDGAKISVGLTPREGVLRITKDDRSLELDAKIYSPNLIGPEHEDFKIRVKTALFDIKMAPRGGGATQARVTLELETVWDHYVAAELASWEENEQVEFQIECEAGILFNGSLRPTLPADEGSQKIASGCRLAVLLVGRQALVELSPEHNRAWQQITWLATLEPFLAMPSKQLSFQLDSPRDVSCFHILAFIVFELGDFFYSVNLAFSVRHQTVQDDQWQLYFDSFEVLNFKRFKTDYANMHRMAQQEFDKLVEGRQQCCVALGSGDLIDWFSRDQDRNFITLHQPD